MKENTKDALELAINLIKPLLIGDYPELQKKLYFGYMKELEALLNNSNNLKNKTMRKVVEFLLEPVEAQGLVMPQGREFLSVEVREGNFILTAVVDDLTDEVPVTIKMLQDGHEVKEYEHFIGTLNDGSEFLYHVFESFA